MAFPVSFGLSSAVRNRSSAPMPKITKASVWLLPLSSAMIAPTMPRRMSALRSSRSESGSKSDERRGCHAIDPRAAHGQAETEKESQHEFRMRELLEAVLNRLPRIAVRINAAGDGGSGSGPLEHLFGRISGESRMRQNAEQREHCHSAERAGESATKRAC